MDKHHCPKLSPLPAPLDSAYPPYSTIVEFDTRKKASRSVLSRFRIQHIPLHNVAKFLSDFWKNIVAMEGRGEGGGEKQSTRSGQGSVAGNRGEAAVQNCRGCRCRRDYTAALTTAGAPARCHIVVSLYGPARARRRWHRASPA